MSSLDNRNQDNLSEGVQCQDQLKKRVRYATGWFFIFTLLFLAVFIYLFARATYIVVFQSWAWKDLYAKFELKDRSSTANRGNIYSDDGTALAISVPMYKIEIDFKAGGFKDSLFLSKVDSLSSDLSNYFQDKSKADYKKRLLNGYKNRNKRKIIRLIDKEISHGEFLHLKQMPFFNLNNSNKTGLVKTKTIRRLKPFGTMASRTIGFLEKDVDSLLISHGSSGLELGLDSILCGKPGIDKMIRIGRGYVRKPKIMSVNGKDIYTTINVQIQDITDRCLKQMLIDEDADWGCAIVMEVKTGEIKAISNLNRISDGLYMESTNHAVADLLEPGSTFKTASILLALDDGVCEPTDTVNTFRGSFPYAGRQITDHNKNHGGYGKITVAQAMWYSSNIGVARTILKAYEKDPQRYLNGLDRLAFFAPISLQIPGIAQARIKRDVSKWARTSLPWISFGYETQIPPIFTCRFYNAIANNGTMMQPFIVKSIREENDRGQKTIEEFDPIVVKKHIASSSSIRKIQEMLRGVVENGTAKVVNSPYVKIAGKTGTAIRSDSHGYNRALLGYNLSFCGFFPYGHPKYTCMVTISHPRVGYPSSGKICGVVVKNIAEEIYATTMSRSIDKIEPDSSAVFKYPVYGGERKAILKALDITDIPSPVIAHSDWVTDDNDKDREMGQKEELTPVQDKPQTVPNLIGMSVIDAIYLAEKCHLHVSIVGNGSHVISQSLHAGDHFKGNINITLKVN